MRSTGARLNIVRDELPELPSRTTVGLLCADKRTTRAASRVISASSASVLADGRVETARRWVDEGKVDVLVIDGDIAQNDADAFAALMARDDLPALVFLSGGSLDSSLMHVGQRCRHVVAKVSHAPAAHMGSLLTTLRKIVDRDIFGAEKYVGWGATVHTVRVHNSLQKQAALDVFDDFLSHVDCDRRYRQALGVTADELLTNALFCAPVDAQGRRRFDGSARQQGIVLAPAEAPSLEYTTDGQRVAVAVRDPFGTLIPEDALTGIQSSAIRFRTDHPRSVGDGHTPDPPMGLFIAYRAMDQLVLNVAPGHASEVIGVLDVSERYRAHQARPKSVHAFTLRALDAPRESHSRAPESAGRVVSPLETEALREVGILKREAQAARKREALSRTELERKDQLLVQVAHELRNTITPLRYGIELTESVAPAPMLRRMDRHLAHMERLLEDLVDLSRANLGEVELVKAEVDLATLVGRAVEMSCAAQQGSNHDTPTLAHHTLKTELPKEPLAVLGDETRLLQILVNLLQNAAKYTPAGGEVCVRAGCDGDHVVIEVADTGVGIARDMLERIFEPFARVDRSTSGHAPGVGVGLTVVRRLVELHGGKVTASSGGAGMGSTFEVHLPRSSRSPMRPARR